jgi:hypothetical protein
MKTKNEKDPKITFTTTQQSFDAIAGNNAQKNNFTTNKFIKTHKNN